MANARINLIPAELRPRITIPAELRLVAGCGAVLVLIGLSAISQSISIHSKETVLGRIQAEKNRLVAEVAALTQQNAKVTQAEARYTSIQDVLKKKTYWVEIFKELTAVMPKGVWLTHLVSTITDKERSLTLKGETSSQSKVARFFQDLEVSYYFSNIVMKNSEKQGEFRPDLFKFEFSIPISREKYGKL